MLLTPVDRVAKLLGVGNAITADIKPAIETAGTAIENVLNTKFSYATQTDYFDSVGSPFKYSPVPVRLLLTNGYVTNETFTIRYSEDGLPLRDSASGVLLDPSSYIVDRIKGTVMLLVALPLCACGITVTYSSGFDEDSSGAIVDGPGWLTDACATMAAYVLKALPLSAAQRTSTAKGQKPGLMEKENLRFANALVAPHFRPRGNYQTPLFSIEAE